MAKVSIAVLPFNDGSPAKDQAHFCDGVANDLLNALGNASNLHCAPRSAAFGFRGPDPDLRKLGEQLDVSFALNGTLSRAGDKLQLKAILSSTVNAQAVWSKEYAGGLSELFAFVDDVLAHVTKAIGATAVEGRRFTIQLGTTTSIRAYDLYLRGLALFHDRYSSRNCELARDTFQKAVETDPKFAKAWARLADCHSTFYMLFDSSTPAHWQKAREAAQKAVEIEPNLPLAHTSLGMALTLAKEFASAESEFEKAIAMNPRYFEAYYHYARMTFQQGNLKKAAPLFEKAAKVRPEDYQVPLLLRQVYLSLGRLDDAMRTARQGIALAQRHLQYNPNDARAVYLASGSMIQLGMYREAVEWAERALRIDPDDPIINYNVACCYAQAGEPDKAMDCLEKAKRSGTISLGWLRNDSDLVALMGHPRFQALLKELEAAGQ